MKCLYRTRPYELISGSAEKLHEKWRDISIKTLTGGDSGYNYKELCTALVKDFDSLPLNESLKKPRVGIVGEILVKYMPLANNHLVELLEKEGAEAVVPDLMDFMNYCLYNTLYKREYLGASWASAAASKAGLKIIETVRRPAVEALRNSSRFEPGMPIDEIGQLAAPLLSLGNQYGEGWFLAGEMVELLKTGVPNIVCIQPFACLPNHVVGKGVIKQLKKSYPQANIAAVDYDPGASEVNQLNRIKLMLSAAKSALEEDKSESETAGEEHLIKDNEISAGLALADEKACS